MNADDIWRMLGWEFSLMLATVRLIAVFWKRRCGGEMTFKFITRARRRDGGER
jgi:hypothetical protein